MIKKFVVELDKKTTALAFVVAGTALTVASLCGI
jgi:hypothetical protein